ncbi:MAG: hypothetical protein AB8B63_01065 [Granulosicoccus sp.]
MLDALLAVSFDFTGSAVTGLDAALFSTDFTDSLAETFFAALFLLVAAAPPLLRLVWVSASVLARGSDWLLTADAFFLATAVLLALAAVFLRAGLFFLLPAADRLAVVFLLEDFLAVAVPLAAFLIVSFSTRSVKSEFSSVFYRLSLCATTFPG